jgi:hypothetical protein
MILKDCYAQYPWTTVTSKTSAYPTSQTTNQNQNGDLNDNYDYK